MGVKGSFLGVKWLGREADHSPPSSAEVKNAWSYTCTPLVGPPWRGAQLKKAQGQLYLYLYCELTPWIRVLLANSHSASK
jgi:hypothetical protein